MTTDARPAWMQPRAAFTLSVVVLLDRAWRLVAGIVGKLPEVVLARYQRSGAVDGVLPSARALELACRKRIGLNELSAPAAQTPFEVETWPADVLALLCEEYARRERRARHIARSMPRGKNDKLIDPWRAAFLKCSTEGELAAVEAATAGQATIGIAIRAAVAAHRHLQGLERQQGAAASRMEALRKLKGAA
jgi:hypothetical protein